MPWLRSRWFAVMSAGLLTCGTVVGVAAADQPAPSQEGEVFQIDPVHSVALFRVRHGPGMFWGRFDDVRGSIHFNPTTPSPIELDVRVAIASVHSGNGKLDGHLKSADFFDAEQYPHATFKSTSTKRLTKTTYAIRGDFTLHGVTRPLTVNVEWLGVVDSPRGRGCGLESSFDIQRSDYGMTSGVSTGALGDATRIVVALEGWVRAQEDEASAAGGLPDRLARFDANGDGKLQKGEAPERMRARFERLDRNSDGEIDAEEAAAMRNGGFGGGGG